jgi:succinate dehydrogenase / fumarate reductase cytochrome b subunit
MTSTLSRPRRRTFYRGDPGMWSWVLHRITGATVFFFLFVHVLDTALVRVSPEAYNAVVDTYKTPIVGLMELVWWPVCSTTDSTACG